MAADLRRGASLTLQQRADVGPDVKLIGRWHDTGARTGVAIFEATDALAWSISGTWNPYMDIDVAPVLDDEETAALARVTIEDQSA